MKLAAIDIGTNSIHMVIAEAAHKNSFQIIDREKEMVKLGVGVFSTNRLSERAFKEGLETIKRYVQLADQRGADEIITAATSATREAHNGSDFLNELVRQTGISPEVISGGKEARLIFKAVRNEIALRGENAMIIDIGGGSTEIVVGNEKEILMGKSMKLGVLRLLDMFNGDNTVGEEALGVLQAHIRFVAQSIMTEAKEIGFTRIIGTSGTIRTLGEAAHIAAGGKSMKSVNAEVVKLNDLDNLTKELLKMKAEKRAEINAIGEKRADAIHLGGALLVQLLQMAGVEEITLCDASLREGLILDYLDNHAQNIADFPESQDLRHRSAFQLAHQFNVDWQQKIHVASLSLQLFDQTQKLHELEHFERDILEYASLLHSVGQYIRFEHYHKHSRYIIAHAGLRGFNDEEILLISHVARYHRKAEPKKKHKKYKKLSKRQRKVVKVLSAVLRVAVSLDRTKNQLVKEVACKHAKKKLVLQVAGRPENMKLELWATRKHVDPLAKALKKEVSVEAIPGDL
ncbi:exopolyphosphatase/guanosine-5'-triphosphate,3'-diphosphate pyrophosphatase [Catalinimonas alkaloidigena]|uniref:Ppx/GppA phosphatase family protein n=1 Tax=Catalinimonas alkaloidigena TaxID=1075417 RepID=UPI00240497E5|nr:Ppx/GppA phosphatase family protein [Catalinimonas alkaloidigena]MDF9795723.1 exopolyphosphatase/guanosine-5'-triphosphate,3'-diphosphate pyrophosphatase [Catalinimonas alkaloidigena]